MNLVLVDAAGDVLPMTRREIAALATSIRAVLDGPDAGLTEPMRRRWEGALAATEAILGRPSSLLADLGL
jgi:hypothetical protein